MVQVLTLGVGDCELVLMTLHTFARGMSTQLKLEVRGNDLPLYLETNFQRA